jgi:Ser/Thr protein kinase RdoA (MazF antagonist)
MDGTLVDGDWPALKLDEVGALLEKYPGSGAPRRILSVSPRPFSAASVVETTAGCIFVKKHPRSVRTAEGLGEEHAFMRYLREHGAGVPRVFLTESGASAVECDGWTYEVHALAEGVDAYEQAISWTPFLTVAHARAAGVAQAKLHLAAEGFRAPKRAPHPLVASFSIFSSRDPLKELDRYFAARPALAASAAALACARKGIEVLEPFAAELRPLLPALPALWTHNDLHASNLFWSDAGPEATVTAAVDFGLCDRTNAVFDLAQTIERNIVEWVTLMVQPDHPEAVAIHFDHLTVLLKGYESVRPLSREEKLALRPMVALCHAEFALTEADYFLAALHSEERAKVAYDDYLIGHAQWFHGAGAKLLDALGGWAMEPAAVEEEQ